MDRLQNSALPAIGAYSLSNFFALNRSSAYKKKVTDSEPHAYCDMTPVRLNSGTRRDVYY
jgi:hypothetical protein